MERRILERWHGSCERMRRMFQGASIRKKWKPIAVSALLLIAIGITAIVPPPGQWDENPASNVGQYYQISCADYITPVLASSFLVKALNVEAEKFSGFGGYDIFHARINSRSGPKLLPSVRYIGNIFHVANIKFLLKRSGQEEKNGIYISESLWEAEFGRAGDVLDRNIKIGDQSCRIIGVTKASDGLFEEIDLWLPLQREPDGANSLRILARLKVGAMPDEAQAQIARAAARLENEWLALNGGMLRICPVDNMLRPKYAPEDAFAFMARKSLVHKS
jgi:hypothetical protein